MDPHHWNDVQVLLLLLFCLYFLNFFLLIFLCFSLSHTLKWCCWNNYRSGRSLAFATVVVDVKLFFFFLHFFFLFWFFVSFGSQTPKIIFFFTQIRNTHSTTICAPTEFIFHRLGRLFLWFSVNIFVRISNVQEVILLMMFLPNVKCKIPNLESERFVFPKVDIEWNRLTW